MTNHEIAQQLAELTAKRAIDKAQRQWISETFPTIKRTYTYRTGNKV